MTKTITFNELRRIKDSLPDGSIQRIADELGLKVETVRNYFGGHNFRACFADTGRESGCRSTESVREIHSYKKSHS